MAEAASNSAAKTSTIADPKTSVGSTTNSTAAHGSFDAASVSNHDNSSSSTVSNATPAVSGAAATVDPAESRVPLQGAELKAALVSQIEYIFSREYLSGDYSIVSQMNGDLFLSLPFVYELIHFKNLTTDTNAILEALQSSNKVVLDLASQRVRPNFKLQRNTIILRDIPSDFTEVEIRALFDDANNIAPQITEVKKDIENTWFVSFSNEDITTDAFLHVRSKKINDSPVQARVKSENLLKSTYSPAYLATNPYAYQQNYASTQYSNGYQQPRNNGYQQGRNYDRNYDASGKKRGAYAGNNSRRGAQGTQPASTTGRRGPNSFTATNANGQTQKNAAGSTTQSGTRQQGGAKRDNTSRGQQQQKGGRAPAQATQGQTGAAAGPKISSADFPPLSRVANSDLKHMTKEQILSAYGASMTGVGIAGDDLSAFETTPQTPSPQFLMADSPVLSTTAQEPELSKPAPQGSIKADLLESAAAVGKRRSSSAGSQGRPPSNPRQRPEQPQLTAAQVAAASADKRPPLPPGAATKKPMAVTSAPKQAPKPKETKAEAPKAAPVPTKAEAPAPKTEAPKSTGPSWSDIAKAQAAAAAAKEKAQKSAPKAAAPAAAAAPTPSATPVVSSSSSAAPASN